MAHRRKRQLCGARLFPDRIMYCRLREADPSVVIVQNEVQNKRYKAIQYMHYILRTTMSVCICVGFSESFYLHKKNMTLEPLILRLLNCYYYYCYYIRYQLN